MSLSWSEFKEQASVFLSSTITHGDDWEWSQVSERPGYGYLAKKRVAPKVVDHPFTTILNPIPLSEGEEEEDESDEIPGLDDVIDMDDDQATLQHDPKINSNLYIFDYHIVYSTTYQQPVLYFNAFKPDGKLLTHNEILYTLQISPGSENHPFISQKEHPVLGIPFYHIHPCETSKLMKEILISKPTPDFDYDNIKLQNNNNQDNNSDSNNVNINPQNNNYNSGDNVTKEGAHKIDTKN